MGIMSTVYCKTEEGGKGFNETYGNGIYTCTKYISYFTKKYI
jgi:hypothetical protein